MQGNVRVARAEPPGGGALGKAVSGRAGRARLDVRDRQIAADPRGITPVTGNVEGSGHGCGASASMPSARKVLE